MVTKREKIVSLKQNNYGEFEANSNRFLPQHVNLEKEIVLTKEATVFKLFIRRLN